MICRWQSPLLCLGLAGLAAAAPLPFPNAGFEEGLTGWTLQPKDAPVAQVCAAAASLGTQGLRVADADQVPVWTLTGPAAAVTPGRRYAISCWARSRGAKEGLSVKMLFQDAAGKRLAPGRVERFWDGAPVREPAGFDRIVLQALAPEGAATLAAQILSYSAPGAAADLDDFLLEEVENGQLAPPPVAALLADLQARPTRGNQPPPKIVLKLDDLRPRKGQLHPRWQKIADFLRERKLKGSFGMICDCLEQDPGPFAKVVQDWQAEGLIEIWFHGYDHGSYEEAGKKLYEFQGAPPERQREHFARSSQLAREKLGLTLRTFGAPEGRTDAETRKLFNADPELRVWLSAGGPGPELAPGKVALGRLWCACIENPLFTPNSTAIIEGYAHNRDRDYFVLQGHPASWDDKRFAEFVKLVDFLIGQKCEFVTPAEMAQALLARPAPQP